MNKSSLRFLISFFLVFLFMADKTKSQNSNSAIFEGKLIFNFNVDTAFVQFGITKPSIRKIASGDTLVVSNGFYHLFLSYPTNKDVYLTQNVLKDSVYTINHRFDLSDNVIDINSSNAALKYLIGGDTIVLTDPETKIYVNDQLKAEEYFAFFTNNDPVKIGFDNPEFYRRETNHQNSGRNKIHIERFYFYPGKDRFPIYAALPGLSYLKEKDYSKLGIILTGITTSTVFFIKYQNEYSSMLPEYNLIRNQYLNESNESNARALGNEMESVKQEFNSINIKRNAALYSLIGFITVDIINKIRLYRKLEVKNNRKIDFFIEPKLNKYLSMGASIKF